MIRPPGGRVFDGVIQNIDEHLPQTVRVGVDGDHLLRLGVVEQQPLLPDARLAEEHRIGQFCHQVQRAALHADASVLQAAEIQQLLHHIVQPPGLVVDDFQPLAVVLVGGVVQGHQGLYPPRIEVSGVRSSWDTELMNSFFIFSVSSSPLAI